MNEGSSPPKLVRTEALSFFSVEEVARARSYHRPLYWAAAADVAIEASVLGALVWSGAGAALDPGSLPWWGRTPAYAAIVVAASVAVRLPLALWSGFVRERRWGFSTQRWPSWVADRAKAVGVNVVLTAAALLGLVGLARALPGWWPAPAAAAFAFAALLLSFVAPVVLEPLFNRYSPLRKGGAGGGAAQTRGAGRRPRARRARPRHEPSYPESDRVCVTDGQNEAGAGLCLPARPAVAAGRAAGSPRRPW